MASIKRTVTITREVTGPIRDLVGFVMYLQNRRGAAKSIEELSTDDLVEYADAYYEQQHGDEHG